MAVRQALGSTHRWTRDDTTLATLHTPKSAGYPRIKIDELPGWWSLPETSDSAATSSPGRIGEVARPKTSIGKTLTYNGRIMAKTSLSEATAHQALVGAFADRSRPGLMAVEPWHPSYGTAVWAYEATVMQLDGDEQQELGMNAPLPFQRAFVLGLRMRDGRFYHWNESGSSGVPMDWSGAGGVTVQNNGTAPTDPTIRVNGITAGQDVHLILDAGDTNQKDLWFKGLPAGDIIVGFAEREAHMADGTDVSDLYDELDSTWWDEYVDGVPPGSHDIAYGPGAGTSLEVQLYSAYW